MLAGGSLGLAVLTKTTALVFAAPFVLAAVIVQFRRGRTQPGIQLLVASAVLIGLVNAGHFSRNLAACHSPLGPRSVVGEHTNAIYTPPAIASNVIRQLAMHLAMPLTFQELIGKSDEENASLS